MENKVKKYVQPSIKVLDIASHLCETIGICIHTSEGGEVLSKKHDVWYTDEEDPGTQVIPHNIWADDNIE